MKALLLILALSVPASAAPVDAGEARRLLSETAASDMSPAARLAALQESARAYPDPETSKLLERALRTEPDPAFRSALVVFLSTAPEQVENAEVTRVMGDLLGEDSDPGVRRAAAAALAKRGDLRVIGALQRATDGDADKGVRSAAAAAIRELTRAKPAPAKAKKAKAAPVQEPDPNGVKGTDPCPMPWAWCDCGGYLPTRSRCLRQADCREMHLKYKPMGMSCSWNEISFEIIDQTSPD